jgi:hypothetical protein
MADLEALVVAAYVFADGYPVPVRGGRRPLITDAELVALAVCQAAIGISSDRPPGWSGRADLGRAAAARWLAGYRPCPVGRRNTASSGAPASSCSPIPAGLPLGYTIAPANEHEYEPLADLLTGTPAEVVTADKGFWGADDAARLAAGGTTLLTPNRTRTASNLGRERALAATRLLIESVFANLKGQTRLEHHLAKTADGPAVRIAQRILALTIGILLNTLTGRPARALAANDGRRITSSL